VPNLYPAVERQEVVIHSPRHVRSFAELTDEEVELVARAWFARWRAAVDGGFERVFWLINEGRPAGSSLPHSHSQLVLLREPPPEERTERAVEPGCGVCEIGRRWSGGSELSIAGEVNGVEAFVHPAGRVPYELLIASWAHDLDFPAALMILRESIRRLRAVEGPVPWNAWLHQGFGENPHVHLHVLPRLTVMAGLELGAGIYVNSLDPDEAAKRLREVSPPLGAQNRGVQLFRRAADREGE
jgi:UDPglucose--hexose-1-phosphate uridylyltransferase